jgi:hypothetical protein
MEGQRTVQQLRRIVAVAVLSCIAFRNSAADTPPSTKAELISATRRYFTASCVFLVHSEELQTSK